MTPPTEQARAQDLLRWRQKKILVLGDLALESNTRGHMATRAPGNSTPALQATDKDHHPAGAGHLACALKALDTKPLLIAILGDDPTGALLKTVTQDSLPHSHLLTIKGGASPLRHNFFAHSLPVFQCASRGQLTITQEHKTRIKKICSQEIPEVDAVVLSDHNQGLLDADLISHARSCAMQHQKPLIVDAGENNFALYHHADLVIANRHQLTLAACPETHEQGIAKMGEDVLNRNHLKALLVTLAGEGLLLLTANQQTRGRPPHHFPTQASAVFDTSGAGETVAAIAAAALASQLPLGTIARLANIGGGLAVSKPGLSLVTFKELHQHTRQESLLAATQKIVSLDSLHADCTNWRHQGLVIGFTNGCFDLLHPGHISLLEQAKACCDRLIVGLNGDSSVRRLKGHDRPVQGEDARAIVLASLSCVDRVALFEDDTPMTIITSLKPDRLIKGADYTLDQIPGADFVQANGGLVILAELTQGLSTSQTIHKVRK